MPSFCTGCDLATSDKNEGRLEPVTEEPDGFWDMRAWLWHMNKNRMVILVLDLDKQKKWELALVTAALTE